MTNLPSISPQAKELAGLMYLNKNTMNKTGGWDGALTFFYLPTKYHMLYSNDRGFGMKVSIEHPVGWGLGITELELEIQLRMNGENSLFSTVEGA